METDKGEMEEKIVMGKYKLTVAIPTYNRPKQLGHTLSVVLPQVLAHDDVQLLVLDNCSPVPAVNVLKDVAKGAELPERIRAIRHVANIGGNGNILRCFELAEGDWLWCLGDDDEPAADAVETILHDISTAKFCYAFYRIFENAPILSEDDEGQYIGASIKEWVRRVPAYGHRLFISSSVFKLEQMRPYLMTGYMVANSGGPHLTMAFLAVMNGGSYMLSDRTICNYLSPVSGAGYNCAPLAYGSTSLVMIIGNACPYGEYKNFFGDALATWVAPQRLLNDVIQLHGNYSRRLIRKNFGLIACQFKPLLCDNPLAWLKWTICQIFAFYPTVFVGLRGLWHRRHENQGSRGR